MVRVIEIPNMLLRWIQLLGMIEDCEVSKQTENGVRTRWCYLNHFSAMLLYKRGTIKLLSYVMGVGMLRWHQYYGWSTRVQEVEIVVALLSELRLLKHLPSHLKSQGVDCQSFPWGLWGALHLILAIAGYLHSDVQELPHAHYCFSSLSDQANVESPSVPSSVI